ncbi:cobyrinic acid a,c-diamide synthase [Nocardia amikacinitolerans]|uniref:Hydrogenobyrinate a,c-diamide synthase n=1 Tax=Nocardia amikacinitolerans TaxID=756689 RepID=A0A285LUQ6_9NOCA|nr:cobyrinate a,c-diamide synthase [Nocardia amikacinitolerans]SNY88664.1 cobyrinic acid a,c-diamide synthase [Nocardia amikacinitolerans]
MGTVPAVVVAAPASGSGKTTLATGLIGALRRAGHRVAPFKVGPDYIDPGYHGLAAGRPGRNLDPVLVGADRVAPLYHHGAAGCDLAVIEGVMGLFDGRIDEHETGPVAEGSTAQVAGLLGAPVVLVVDARGHSQSLAALLHGFATFDSGVRLGGVILNRVGSERHDQVLRAACARVGLPVLGSLPRMDALEVPSRHLGLIPAVEHGAAASAAVAAMTDLVAAHVDLAAVAALARPAIGGSAWDPVSAIREASGGGSAIRGGVGTTGAARRAAGSSALGEPDRPIQGGAAIEPGRLDEPIDGGAATGQGRVSGGEPTARRPIGAHGGGSADDHGARAARSIGVGPAEWVAAESVGTVDGGAANEYPVVTPTSAWPILDNLGRSRDGATGTGGCSDGPVIAMAGGPAFTFGYAEHRELLIAAGARVVVFDPLRDELPSGTAGLVLPGGFPEEHAADLAANTPLLAAVRAHARAGLPIHAECAGLLYLTRSLDGHAMAGVVDADAEFGPRLTLGYRDAVALADSALWRAGERVRGHEFHRTRLLTTAQDAPAWGWQDGSGARVREGALVGRVHASYLHTHPAGNPAATARFVVAADDYAHADVSR